MPVDTPLYRMTNRMLGGKLDEILMERQGNWPALARRLYAEHGVEVSHVTLQAWADTLRSAEPNGDEAA